MYTHFLGIDVSKDTLDLALLTADHVVVAQTCIANKPAAIRQWVKGLPKQVPGFGLAHCLVCLEHTGLYNRPVLAVLDALQAPVWVERPVQIKTCMGAVRGKTDAVDAVRIAQYAARYRDQVKLWQPRRDVLEALDRLTARRARLVEVLKVLQTPLSSSKGFFSAAEQQAEQRGCAASLKALKADLAAVEQAIAGLIAGDPTLAHLHERVMSVPGIGPVTAAEILLTTNEFKDSPDAKHYACYAGVVPFETSSGQRKGRGRVSPQANQKLKRRLHLGALTAVRYCAELKAYYERKVAEGKNKMLVLNNGRNKIIHRVFACVRNDQKYDKNYVRPLA